MSPRGALTGNVSPHSCRYIKQEIIKRLHKFVRFQVYMCWVWTPFGSHMSPAGSRLFELFNVIDACRAFSQLSCLIKGSSPLSPANGQATQPVSQCCKLAALISRTKLRTQGESFLLGTHEDVRQEVSRWRLQREFETSPGLQEKRLGACWFVVSKVCSLYFDCMKPVQKHRNTGASHIWGAQKLCSLKYNIFVVVVFSVSVIFSIIRNIKRWKHSTTSLWWLALFVSDAIYLFLKPLV